MAASSYPNAAIVLRRTGVFSVFGLAGDGVQAAGASAQTAAAAAAAAAASSSLFGRSSPEYWVDDQYDKKDNMEYELDELMQFARKRVLAPHDDRDVVSAAALAALQQASAEATRKKLASARTGGMDALFPENWGMSQFWYTPETCDVISRAIELEASLCVCAGGAAGSTQRWS